MTIIYYDTNTCKPEQLYKLVQTVKGELGNVLCLPKDFDVLLNASEEQLISIRNTIDAALQQKTARSN